MLGYNEKEHHANKMFACLLNEAGDYEGYANNFAGLLKNYFGQEFHGSCVSYRTRCPDRFVSR